jgi:Domain of unknown function (DUF4397)
MRKVLILCTAGMVVSMGGCPLQPDGQNGKTARLRVIHASPDAPAVDVCANGQAAFEGAAFSGATAYATLDEGTYAIRVTAAGAGCDSAGVINASLPLSSGQDVSVVAVNRLSQIEPLVLIDNNASPAAGKAKVRFVHAGPDAPTVDITLTDGTTLFDNVSFKQSSGYLEVAAGSYDLQVRDETGAAVVLTLNDTALGAGNIYTVFAVGLLNGTPALNALVTLDNP